MGVGGRVKARVRVRARVRAVNDTVAWLGSGVRARVRAVYDTVASAVTPLGSSARFKARPVAPHVRRVSHI